MRKYLLIALMFMSTASHAATVTQPNVWANGDTVTAAKLNQNWNALGAALNGGIDNTNVNTVGGYHLYEILSALPTAGTQGRTVYNTSDNTLNTDTGSAWQTTVTPTGTLATGKIPYYSAGWQLLTPGTQYYSLVSNGASSNPSYQQVDVTTGRGVTGTLAIANGGTGQVTAQAAIDALLPSQVGNSGKRLTTNGSASSWVSGGSQLISATTVTAAATSGNIAITNTKYYKVVIHIVPATDDVVAVRFNADTGANYKYAFDGRTTGGAITGGSAAGTSIILSSSTKASSVGDDIEIAIYPQVGTGNINLNGKITYIDTAGSLLTYTDFGGTWNNAAAATSFSVITTGGGNYTGSILLYEMLQS